MAIQAQATLLLITAYSTVIQRRMEQHSKLRMLSSRQTLAELPYKDLTVQASYLQLQQQLLLVVQLYPLALDLPV